MIFSSAIRPTSKGIFFSLYFSFFFLTLGPALPKTLYAHSTLEIQGDVFLFGGNGSSYSYNYNSAIYQLSCSSAICSWATLNQALTVGRRYTVAIPVPDSFCFEEGDDTTPSGSGGTSVVCYNPSWIGDGYCDDVTNNIGCNFDGGDCCEANVNTNYCSECLCLTCNQGWIGDGYCDDINNNVGCNFDGGDCCGSNANTQYCIECLCFE